MNNDLISRSELKKALSKNITIWTFNVSYDGILAEIIDNAPTVFSCNACKNMGNERECVDCHDYSNYVHYEERPQGDCQNCDFRKFSETFINGIVEVMTKNGIESVEQLSEILGKGNDNE